MDGSGQAGPAHSLALLFALLRNPRLVFDLQPLPPRVPPPDGALSAAAAACMPQRIRPNWLPQPWTLTHACAQAPAVRPGTPYAMTCISARDVDAVVIACLLRAAGLRSGGSILRWI